MVRTHPGPGAGPQAEVARELEMVTLPSYTVAAPDILLIDAVSNIRPADSPLNAGDAVTIRLQGGVPIDVQKDADLFPLEYQHELEQEIANKIINGEYVIGSDGAIDLGPVYGKVSLEGLTLDQAREALLTHFVQNVELKDPQFTITMPDLAGRQAVVGEHLVRPDGTISLGIYGDVYVSGLTLPQVKAAVEAHLSTQMHRPEVTVDVVAYNSKVIYVIMDGGGYGEQVIRLPCTGNETVLDAVSQIYGLAQVSSKKIWISRPGPAEYECAQILDVHWREITREGITTTNYQLFPGDRIYVQADCMIATDNWVGKIIAPFERILGFTALGTGTVRGVRFFYNQGQ
jgi:protein involved in polysaccharide export with SLBB domain